MGEKQLTKEAKAMLGEPKKALRVMAIPMLVSLLVAQVNSFVDTFWCSVLGSMELAAVGITTSFYFILSGIGFGVGIGVSASIAANVAMERKHEADLVATQSLVFMAIVGVLFAPIMYVVSGPICLIVGGEELYADCVAYGVPYYIGSVFIVLQGIAAGILRGEGASRRSMIILSLAAIFNMLFDPLFTFTFGWGICGLSWATVVATALSFIPFIWWYGPARETSYVDILPDEARPTAPVLRNFLSVGVPKAVELDVMSIMNFPLNYLVVKCAGSLGFAVYATSWKYVDLMLVPSLALGGALVPICAAAFQRGDLPKAREAYNYAMSWTLFITVAEAVLLFIFNDWAAMVFTSSDASAELRKEIAITLQIYAFVGLAYSTINISSSFLQSMGMAASSMWSTLLRNIALLGAFYWASTFDFSTIRYALLGCEVFGAALMIGWAEMGYKVRLHPHITASEM